MSVRSVESFHELVSGNERFVAGQGGVAYSQIQIAEVADAPAPIAAVIGCIDSRTAPEIIFDQGLGRLFVTRTPGNVAADSVKWMLEIAVGELGVPLIVIMAHTRCLAVRQIIEGKLSGPGGFLRMSIGTAVMRAQSRLPEDLEREALIENAIQTAAILRAESHIVGDALDQDRVAIAIALYHVETGRIEWIESPISNSS